jgi:Prolyl oligopeptidase family
LTQSRATLRLLNAALAVVLASVSVQLAAGGKVPAIALAAPKVTADLAPAALTEKLSTFEEGRWIRDNGGQLRCGVRVLRYEYLTTGGAGEPATASSALMIPTGNDPVCTAPHALLAALHGTMWDRSYDLAQIQDSENTASNRSLSWAALYAAQGYIVVAPNYVGFNSSSSAYHPYLDYHQQTRDVLDAISSAKELLSGDGIKLSGKLFLTGFSQGGWLSMAVHRRIEASGGQLTASMPSAGGYALTPLVDDIFLGRPVQGSTIYFPMALAAARKAGVTVYSDPAQFFSTRYAKGVEQLLPGPRDFGELVRAEKLPATALFSSATLAVPKNASRNFKDLLKFQGPEAD